jgi:hypothetical protein
MIKKATRGKKIMIQFSIKKSELSRTPFSATRHMHIHGSR